jgi:hypothetical protein
MKLKSQVLFVFFLRHFYCLIPNPGIGILTETNFYLARIIELNSTIDESHRIYHHNDPVYSLQSFAVNHLQQRVYICTPSAIYAMDSRPGSRIVPLLPIDDTPCRSSLTYLPSETVLLWALRHEIIQLDLLQMSKDYLWNSTSSIVHMIHNETIVNNTIDFYLSIKTSDQQSSILHCRSNRHSRILPYQSCHFIDSNYHEISALAIDSNLLYVADRLEKRIYVLTISSNSSISSKTILPLNTSTVADIQSMVIYNQYLIWLTTSGHVRIVSLKDYRVRNLFWFDEQLRTIQILSISQWSNETTTSKTTMITTSPSKQIDTTTIIDENPWKITTYITSILLGFALFLCAALFTCVLLNNRLGRMTPRSFTNIFHILHRRTVTTATNSQPVLNE